MEANSLQLLHTLNTAAAILQRKMFTNSLKLAGLRFRSSQACPSYRDRQHLVEVFQNLLDNAVKFMGNQPDPRVEISQCGEKYGKPVFYVKDNGIGIAPEHHEWAFGLFNPPDPKVEGIGVGLALMKRIIEFHDGRI